MTAVGRLPPRTPVPGALDPLAPGPLAPGPLSPTR
jgi:hypothetical protein